MSEENALLALKNAWHGAVAAADEARALGTAVAAIPASTPLADLDFDTYERVARAQANAVMALVGLLEQLRRAREAA